MTIAEENSIVEPGVLIVKTKTGNIKFHHCNVYKTNDADFNCVFFWFSLVFGCSRDTGLLTRSLAPGKSTIFLHWVNVKFPAMSRGSGGGGGAGF